MTQGDLNAEIISMQCEHVDLTSKLVNYLSIGSPKVMCYNRKNVSVAWAIKVLRRYKAFTAPVTFATKWEFNRVDTPDATTGLYGPVTITAGLGINVFNAYLNGTGSAEDMAIWFENQINNTATAIAYEPVVRVGNTLYIYSYDAAASFSDVVLLASQDLTLATTNITNLQNKTSEILDTWNHITHDEVCCLIGFIHSQAQVNVSKAGGGSSGCGC